MAARSTMRWTRCAAPGSQIKLTVYRPGRDEPLDFTLTRRVIKLRPVEWKVKDNIGRDLGVELQRERRQRCAGRQAIARPATQAGATSRASCSICAATPAACSRGGLAVRRFPRQGHHRVAARARSAGQRIYSPIPATWRAGCR
jgi:hypothetical protein